MKTFALALASLVVAFTFAPASADAAPLDRSEVSTRTAANLPASFKYQKGSAVSISLRDEKPNVRCFIAKASKTQRFEGHLVRRNALVGYCTDGYVDAQRRVGGEFYRIKG